MSKYTNPCDTCPFMTQIDEMHRFCMSARGSCLNVEVQNAKKYATMEDSYEEEK